MTIHIFKDKIKETAEQFIGLLKPLIKDKYLIELYETFWEHPVYRIYEKGFLRFLTREYICEIEFLKNNRVEIRLDKGYENEIISFIEKINSEILSLEIEIKIMEKN